MDNEQKCERRRRAETRALKRGHNQRAVRRRTKKMLVTRRIK